jgi:hypothetical protein
MCLVKMRRVLFPLLIILVSWSGRAQSDVSFAFTDTAPADLLATRSVVFFSGDYSDQELEETQKGFQQIGIDAVAYFEEDKVLAGKDVSKVYAEYLVSRDIKYILLFEKTQGAYVLIATAFNGKSSFFDNGQPAWKVQQTKHHEWLQSIYRDSWLNQKKQNFLINDIPERQISLTVIAGRRSEFFAVDLKVDNLAVPKTGDEQLDKELEQFFAANYPFKYKIVEANYDEKESRKLGFHYVLTYIHTKGRSARELLGYDMSKSENAYASVTYSNGTSQIKTIPADKPIYKFYFKHIESGNVFLGTKWDADETWMQALKNHLMGFRAELRLN